MKFRNYMEELVVEILDEILKDKKEFCDCERCALDAAPTPTSPSHLSPIFFLPK